MLITLTSDMGLRDYYVASIKGAIYNQLPDAKIIDVSHDIPPFDIVHASFVLKNTFKEFPKNTIPRDKIDQYKITNKPSTLNPKFPKNKHSQR